MTTYCRVVFGAPDLKRPKYKLPTCANNKRLLCNAMSHKFFSNLRQVNFDNKITVILFIYIVPRLCLIADQNDKVYI